MGGLWLYQIVGLLVTMALGYPSGAPCGILNPRHPTESQTSSPPFIIELPDALVNDCYMPNQPISVILKSVNQATLKGFVLGAYSMDEDGKAPTNQTKHLAGVFARPLHPGVNWKYHCHTGRISHSDNSEKRNIVVLWKWQKPTAATFRFSATVVQDYETYWSNGQVQSRVIRVCGRDPKHNVENLPPSAPSIDLASSIKNQLDNIRKPSGNQKTQKTIPQAPSIGEKLVDIVPERSDSDYYPDAYYDNDALLVSSEVSNEPKDTLVSTFTQGFADFAKEHIGGIGGLLNRDTLSTEGTQPIAQLDNSDALKDFIKKSIEDIVGPKLLGRLVDAFLTSNSAEKPETVANVSIPSKKITKTFHNLRNKSLKTIQNEEHTNLIAEKQESVKKFPSVVPSAPISPEISEPIKSFPSSPLIDHFSAVQPLAPNFPVHSVGPNPIPTHIQNVHQIQNDHIKAPASVYGRIASGLTSKEVKGLTSTKALSAKQYEEEFDRVLQNYAKQQKELPSFGQGLYEQQRTNHFQSNIYGGSPSRSLYGTSFSGLPQAYNHSPQKASYQTNQYGTYWFNHNNQRNNQRKIQQPSHSNNYYSTPRNQRQYSVQVQPFAYQTPTESVKSESDILGQYPQLPVIQPPSPKVQLSSPVDKFQPESRVYTPSFPSAPSHSAVQKTPQEIVIPVIQPVPVLVQKKVQQPAIQPADPLTPSFTSFNSPPYPNAVDIKTIPQRATVTKIVEQVIKKSAPIANVNPTSDKHSQKAVIDQAVCSLAMDRGDKCGDGGDWQRRWYYSKPFCIEFWWKGCGGNQNQFLSFDDCSAACVRPIISSFYAKT